MLLIDIELDFIREGTLGLYIFNQIARLLDLKSVL